MLDSLSIRKVTVDVAEPKAALGSYSFQAYDPPEVMNVEQASQFLQTDEAVIIEMAESQKLPGRKLGTVWRFSRAALLACLSSPETR